MDSIREIQFSACFSYGEIRGLSMIGPVSHWKGSIMAVSACSKIGLLDKEVEGAVGGK